MENIDQLRGIGADQWMEALWDELLNKLSNTKSKKELKRAFESLISKHEKKAILRRLAVNALVRQGKSYKKIGEILWISPQTISAIRKNSFSFAAAYKSYRSFPRKSRWSRSIKTSKNEKPKIDLWDLLLNPPRPIGTGLMRSAREFNSFKKRK